MLAELRMLEGGHLVEVAKIEDPRFPLVALGLGLEVYGFGCRVWGSCGCLLKACSRLHVLCLMMHSFVFCSMVSQCVVAGFFAGMRKELEFYGLGFWNGFGVPFWGMANQTYPNRNSNSYYRNFTLFYSGLGV